MSILEALILGVIQGLTEFLPVSSSGHLELGKALLNLELSAKDSVLFDVVVHFGTALSTIIVFRKEILEIILGILKFKWNDELKFFTLIVLSMVPAAIIGVLFNDQIEALFVENVTLVSLMLIVTAVLLFFADRAKNTDKNISYLNALIIGISQAIAILPGISRSGATISTSVLLGIDRTKAAKFSFLMVVPLIFAKMGKDILGGDIQMEGGLTLLIAFAASLITGIFACKWMVALVKKSQLKYFSYYCLLIAIIALSVKYLF